MPRVRTVKRSARAGKIGRVTARRAVREVTRRRKKDVRSATSDGRGG